MKNIKKIFRDDVKQLFTSLFIIVIIIGITILPALYAWLNIYSNWDPYGNTAGLKIAYVTLDRGYTPEDKKRENIGNEIKADLEKNDAVDFIFLDKKEDAVNGVKAGKYYAAILVEDDFTYRVYNFLLDDVKKPSLVFYQNEKKNPVATKISDAVINKIHKNINKKLTGIIIEKVFDKANAVYDELEADGGIDGVITDMEGLNAEINNYQKTIQSIIAGNNVLLSALSTSKGNVNKVQQKLASEEAALNDTSAQIKATDVTMQSFANNVNQVLNDSERQLAAMSSALRRGQASGDVKEMADAIDQSIKDADKLIANVDALRKAIAGDSGAGIATPDISQALPSKAEVKSAADSMHNLSGKLKDAANSSTPEDAVAAYKSALFAAKQTADATYTAASAAYEAVKDSALVDDATKESLKKTADAAKVAKEKADSAYTDLSTSGMTAEEIKAALNRASDAANTAANSLDYVYNNYDLTMESISNAVKMLSSYYDSLKELRSALVNAKSTAAGQAAVDKVKNIEEDTSETIDALVRKISQSTTSFETQIVPGVNDSLMSLAAVVSNIGNLMGSLSHTLLGMGNVFDALSVTITSSQDSLNKTADLLALISERLSTATDKVKNVKDSDELNIIINTLSGDPSSYGDFFSEPVQIKENIIYPVKNYGSAVTPFYTTLAIWVGALINVAILNTHVKKGKYPNFSATVQYFGRYLIFFVMSQIQTFVIIMGDLHIFKVQCLHPFLFWVAAAFASLTFSLLIYSLVLAFGDVGKAIAVVVVVIQIAGSSGTYPIELLPDFFQKVYLFFPFPYAINAMREAIGGLYDYNLMIYIVELMVFVGVALVIGLLIRKPFKRLNSFMSKRMEDSGLF